MMANVRAFTLKN
jgi:uncharacterized protein